MYKYLIMALGAFGLLAYTSILRSNNDALQTRIDTLNSANERYQQLANDNAAKYYELRSQFDETLLQLDTLNIKLAAIKDKQVVKEKEIIKYVTQLPDSFEKQCLLMDVPNGVGRLQEQ